MTLFPELIMAVSGSSILGRAQQKGLIEINAVNIRDFSRDKHKKADDYPYGGGSGMVMMAEPIYEAYMSIVGDLETKPLTIYLTPQGKLFSQETAKRLASHKHLVLLCGHYEGVDERVIEEIVDEEISIGDYVLTGGELPALVLVDCVSRLIPGVLGNEGSSADESLVAGLLEYPQYTRPYVFLGRRVPDILLSGHHANIQVWRRRQALKRTLLKRPDLLERAGLSQEDLKMLEEVKREEGLSD